VSSEFILLRESEEFIRKRLSRRSQWKSFSSAGPDHDAHSPFPYHAFFLGDDYQGARDEQGVLVPDDGDGGSGGNSGAGQTPSSDGGSSSRKFQNRGGIINFNPETVVITEDLEVWWITSPKWRRFIPVFCFFCSLLVLIHLAVAFVLFGIGDDLSGIPHPYVCQTVTCLQIAGRMEDSMDRKVRPCDNFYKYMCGNYKGAERDAGGEQPKAPPELTMSASNSDALGDDILGNLICTFPSLQQCLSSLLN